MFTDWCISRQLWWGQRIPAWYYGNNEFVVAEDIEEALSLAERKVEIIILKHLI